ncbi:BNR-4 repeat-containing protein [uncultured Vibrio sp.]|uniref:BNR-4 repeat-containing protein n=1 Tax=uncultured Vibrio sp. TaxID=114054 RepID=UPI0026152110|nr:BNR-4 repeat-containing protein [uncultured Vibrio sp.]
MKLSSSISLLLCSATSALFASSTMANQLSGINTAVPFAKDGHLKMLYDIRMQPSAIEREGKIYITWRGNNSLPQVISYDLESQTFSDQIDVFEGLTDNIDTKGYPHDHHYSPVIWQDENRYFHIIAGCHGLKSHEISACDKVKSKKPADIASGWEAWTGDINASINYPKVMPAYENKTLFYFREGGHLGSWTYRISPNGETDWAGPKNSVVDMNIGANPNESCLDFYAGSYHNARISPDGKKLHISYIWQQEIGSPDVFPAELGDNDCVAPVNSLYESYNVPQGRTRYDLFYVTVDLQTGEVTNVNGEHLDTPVSLSVAEKKALILDTGDRLYSVPPAITLDEDGEPHFLGVISAETPNSGWFTYTRRVNGKWDETKVARTSNVWNSAVLGRNNKGYLRALLIMGEGDIAPIGTTKGSDLNRYGWGDRVEEWVSKDEGKTWQLNRDITPKKGMRYQNIRSVSKGVGKDSTEIFLFYGWAPDGKPGQATGFLWDDRT